MKKINLFLILLIPIISFCQEKVILAVDKNTKKPIWENDNMLENFYEKFGFEPDEQNNECQNKSLQKLNDTPSEMLYHLNKKSYL